VSCRRSDVTREIVEAVEFSSPSGGYGVEGVLRVGPSGLMAPITPDGVIILNSGDIHDDISGNIRVMMFVVNIKDDNIKE